MSSVPGTQMIGADIAQKARAVQRNNRDKWPFWWLFPPFSQSPVNEFNGIALPAVTSSVYSLVLEYDVPSGEVFVMTGLIFQALLAGDFNSAFAPGDGSVLGLLDVNNALNSPLPTGAPVKGFQSVNVPLGDFNRGPFPLSSPFIFNPLDKIRWKVTNVSLATADVFVAAGIFGYTVPLDQAQ